MDSIKLLTETPNSLHIHLFKYPIPISYQRNSPTITKAPVLVSPDFNKGFLIFSYDFDHTVAGVLLQKNEEYVDQPITFLENF